MTPQARLSAAIEIIETIEAQRAPAAKALKERLNPVRLTLTATIPARWFPRDVADDNDKEIRS